jgi:hypothetical protein
MRNNSGSNATPKMTAPQHPLPTQLASQAATDMHQFDQQGRPTRMAFPNDSQKARSHRHRFSARPQLDPAKDYTIALIAARAEDCVADLMQAFFDVSNILDSPTFIAIPYCTRGHRDAFSDIDVEAACREVYHRLLQRCYFGFSGLPSQDRLGRNQQGVTKRTNQTDDFSGDCQTRFNNVVTTLKSWKSVCQEIMHSDAKVINLVNAPATILYDKRTQSKANKTKAATNRERKLAQEQLRTQAVPTAQAYPTPPAVPQTARSGTNSNQAIPTPATASFSPQVQATHSRHDRNPSLGYSLAPHSNGSGNLRPTELWYTNLKEEADTNAQDIIQTASSVASGTHRSDFSNTNRPIAPPADPDYHPDCYTAAPPASGSAPYGLGLANAVATFEETTNALYGEDLAAESNTTYHPHNDVPIDTTIDSQVSYTNQPNGSVHHTFLDSQLDSLDPSFMMQFPPTTNNTQPSLHTTGPFSTEAVPHTRQDMTASLTAQSALPIITTPDGQLMVHGKYTNFGGKRSRESLAEEDEDEYGTGEERSPRRQKRDM